MARKSVQGVGGYKSTEHQRKGGGKTNLDPQPSQGTMKDCYKKG
jgi:hypothetical protein